RHRDHTRPAGRRSESLTGRTSRVKTVPDWRASCCVWGWRFTMRRFFDWRERLAGDRRVVALGEVDRDGVLWVIAHCRSGGVAESLFDSLWVQGWRTLGR